MIDSDPWSGLLEDVARTQTCKELCRERRETYQRFIDIVKDAQGRGFSLQQVIHSLVDGYDDMWHDNNPESDFCPIVVSDVPMAFPFLLIDLLEQGKGDFVIQILEAAVIGTQVHEDMHNKEA